jgi:hypothetical protein
VVPTRDPRTDRTTDNRRILPPIDAGAPSATLTARDAAEYGPGWRFIEIDCDHGTTTSVYKNGNDLTLHDTDIVRAMLLEHYDTERCCCTEALRRRYDVLAPRQEGGRR